MASTRTLQARTVSRPGLAEPRRPRGAYRLAFWLILASAAISLAAGIAASPYFAVTRVEVRCALPAVGREVAQAVRVPARATIFTVRAARLQRQVEACPRAKRIQVGRRWRHTLVVTVLPREPACGIQTSEGWLLSDLEGVCIERSHLAPPSLPRVRGMALARAEPGDRIEGPRMDLAAECVAWAQRLPALRQMTVDVSSLDRVTVVTPGGTRGILGDRQDLGRKLARFAAALEHFRAKGLQAEYVDIRRLDVPIVWKPRQGLAS